MKFFLAAIVFTSCLASCFALADSASVIGDWKLTGFVYQDKPVPPFNPKLNLHFYFFENGTNRLFWNREDETGFCERFANYELTPGQIQQTVFAVNPNNRADCAVDKDMQIGPATVNKMDIEEKRLLLRMQLGEEELVYILTKVE